LQPSGISSITTTRRFERDYNKSKYCLFSILYLKALPFLDEFSKAYPDSLNLLQVDNGRFHTGKDLMVPEHIIWVFQPPYCPELNPIERLWEHLKPDLKWASFKTLEQLQAKVDQLLSQITPQEIASLTGYPFILNALSVVNTI
jgi:hypothetical protein